MPTQKQMFLTTFASCHHFQNELFFMRRTKPAKCTKGPLINHKESLNLYKGLKSS